MLSQDLHVERSVAHKRQAEFQKEMAGEDDELMLQPQYKLSLQIVLYYLLLKYIFTI